MYAFELLLTVDPSLGRLDYSLLSDQALMEMLIDGLNDKSKKEYQNKHGMYLDVCEWSCVKCDDDERVIEIDIESHHARGSLELRYVPPKVKVLKKTWPLSKLTGSVDFTHLPEGIQVIDLQNNRLTGEIDSTELPDGMSYVLLYNNQLTGEINLAQLPCGMKDLSLAKNQFSGEIDLAHLPEGMNYLSLHSNRLTGEIDLTQLPNRMEILFLQNNQLTGEIDLTQLPDRMNVLHLHDNQLSGSLVIKCIPFRETTINAGGNHFNPIAVVHSETQAAILLRGSGVTSVVDENGTEVDRKRFLK